MFRKEQLNEKQKLLMEQIRELSRERKLLEEIM